jgi:hypothetical protein
VLIFVTEAVVGVFTEFRSRRSDSKLTYSISL